MTRIQPIFVAIAVFFCSACVQEFDDPSQSILKKTEIIAITLNPPYATPGDTVTATVHVADSRGRQDTLAAIWNVDQSTPQEMPIGQSISFVVPALPSSAFSEEGVAPVFISVLVATNPAITAADLIKSAQSSETNDNIITGIRTLAVGLGVSTGIPANENPGIHHITVGPAGMTNRQVTFATSTSENFIGDRPEALSRHFTVIEDTEILFTVEATPHFPNTELLYQWFATGGDFKARRDAVEPWIAPQYTVPNRENNLESKSLNARRDPNLHTIWLLVRDDSEAHHLGLTLAEFYVRVLQK